MRIFNVGFLVIVFFLSSCAKERPIYKVKDPEKENKDKSYYTGSGSGTTWLYKATVVKTSSRGGFAFIGYQSQAKAGYFKFTRDKLMLYRADNIYNTSSNLNPSLLNQWSIKHYDVMLSEKDGKVSNKEKEDDQSKWYQKRYFKIDFSKADVSEAAEFPYQLDIAKKYNCWNKKASRLVDDSYLISQDYITFVVSVDYQVSSLCNESLSRERQNDYTYTVHYKYSFKKLEPNSYKPFVYKYGDRDPLSQTFGYFKTFLEKIGGPNGSIKNTVYMNRWDPNKEHHYFFSKDFPERWKWIFNHPKNGIFAKTNELFKKNGLKTKFTVHDNNDLDGKEKKIGDIRYSFINFVKEQDPNAPFGYGPSDTNPFTGEIVSGNIIMWTGYLQFYLKWLKDDNLYRHNQQSDSSLITQMTNSLGKNLSEWGQSMNSDKNKSSDIFFDQLQKTTYANPEWSRNTLRKNEKQFFSTVSNLRLDKLLNSSRSNIREDILTTNKKVSGIIKENLHKEHSHAKQQQNNSTVFSLAPTLADATARILNGENAQELLDTLIYSIAIHEFGHNLNLQHNLYGSVDKRNFGPERIITTATGEKRNIKSLSSSVMDYLTLRDEASTYRDWEPYDQAALLYAYSDGAIAPKKGKKYLYCSNEHRTINAMCNFYDSGSTPTEVLTSIITRYDSLYAMRNYRYDREYWDTTFYPHRIFETMWDVKKFLNMWQSNFATSHLNHEMRLNTELSHFDKAEIIREIQSEMKQAQILAMAFYDGVIQQKMSDRDYRASFDITGDLSRIGILYDKVFAMRFLIGDEGFIYNPNKNNNFSSYLTHSSDNTLKPYIDKYYANALTTRVDMEPWFLTYGRMLFSENATNYENKKMSSYIARMKISKVKAKDMKKYFNIDAWNLNQATETILHKSQHPSFKNGETIGILKIDDEFYITSKSKNPYAYNIFLNVMEDIGSEYSIQDDKLDFLEMFNFYQKSLGL